MSNPSKIRYLGVIHFISQPEHWNMINTFAFQCKVCFEWDVVLNPYPEASQEKIGNGWSFSVVMILQESSGVRWAFRLEGCWRWEAAVAAAVWRVVILPPRWLTSADADNSVVKSGGSFFTYCFFSGLWKREHERERQKNIEAPSAMVVMGSSPLLT